MLLAWTTLMTKQRDRGRVANTRSSEQHTSTVAHSPCAYSQATCDWSVSLILSSYWLVWPSPPCWCLTRSPASSSVPVPCLRVEQTTSPPLSKELSELLPPLSCLLYHQVAIQFRLNTSEQIFIYLIIKSCGHVDLMLDVSGPNDGHLNLRTRPGPGAWQ